MPDLSFKLILTTSDANVKLAEVKQEAESTQSVVEKPVAVIISAEHALATIRNVKIAVDGVISAVSGLVNSMNGLLELPWFRGRLCNRTGNCYPGDRNRNHCCDNP